MKTLMKTGWCLVLGAGLMNLAGCKAKPAESSGFLPDSHLMSAAEHSPFHRMYWNRQHDPAKYTEIMVAPVNTNYVRAQNIWEAATVVNVSHEQIEKDIQALADYTRDSFIRAARNDPRHRVTVVQTAGPHTIILEVALVQVVPSKAVLNALGFVSWVPAAVSTAGSMATGSEDSGKGVVAIEARFRDGQTGEVIGMFADRERPKVALLDLKSLSWWAPAKDIVDEWSAQLIELANSPPGVAVKDSPTFELLVW
jgi:hypothetical protein